MKIWLLLLLCAFAAAAPSSHNEEIDIFHLKEVAKVEDVQDGKQWLVDFIVTQTIRYVRHIIQSGSLWFGIPKLDPFDFSQFHIKIPAGLITMDLNLTRIHASGFGDFVIHKSQFDISDLSLQLDISFNQFNIQADEYDFVGDFFTAIPLYGKGECLFQVDDFRFQTKLYLKQSDNGKAAIIDRIEHISFQLPSLKSHLTGVIGGGDIDAVANAIIEDVIIDYINRFHGIISHIARDVAVPVVNTLLNVMDTWRYMRILLFI